MSEELKRVLRSRQYVLLIGNGINRYFGGGNWIDLLKKVIRRNLGDSSYLESAIGQDGITNTEIQNIIPIEFNRKTGLQIQSKDLLQSVIQNIDRINYDSAPILDRCKNDGCQIITTNFDFNIENYLWRESQYKLIRPTSTRYVTSNYYPWDISFGFPSDKTKVWHMHGSIDKWQSIILSLTRYIGAIHKTSELLKTESPQSSDWIGATTWLKLFFTKPLIIVGLALDPQELFLRWLLLQRASINEQNYQLPSFYLERESSSPLAGKNNFLKFVGVNVCKMGNVYDEAIWKNPV